MPCLEIHVYRFRTGLRLLINLERSWRGGSAWALWARSSTDCRVAWPGAERVNAVCRYLDHCAAQDLHDLGCGLLEVGRLDNRVVRGR